MELMSLKIPSGWWVVKNAFFDVEPGLAEGRMLPEAVFVEDILSLRYRDPWTAAAAADYHVDLGWYPDEDPQGRYRLVLLQRDWEDVLCVYEGRDRVQVRETLERWLAQVGQAADRSDLERRLRSPQPEARAR